MPNHYTKAKGRKAVKAIQAKLLKLHQSGFCSAQSYISLNKSMTQIYNKIK